MTYDDLASLEFQAGFGTWEGVREVAALKKNAPAASPGASLRRARVSGISLPLSPAPAIMSEATESEP